MNDFVDAADRCATREPPGQKRTTDPKIGFKESQPAMLRRLLFQVQGDKC